MERAYVHNLMQQLNTTPTHRPFRKTHQAFKSWPSIQISRTWRGRVCGHHMGWEPTGKWWIELWQSFTGHEVQGVDVKDRELDKKMPQLAAKPERFLWMMFTSAFAKPRDEVLEELNAALATSLIPHISGVRNRTPLNVGRWGAVQLHGRAALNHSILVNLQLGLAQRVSGLPFAACITTHYQRFPPRCSIFRPSHWFSYSSRCISFPSHTLRLLRTTICMECNFVAADILPRNTLHVGVLYWSMH